MTSERPFWRGRYRSILYVESGGYNSPIPQWRVEMLSMTSARYPGTGVAYRLGNTSSVASKLIAERPRGDGKLQGREEDLHEGDRSEASMHD